MRDITDRIYKRFRPVLFVRRRDISAMLKDLRKTETAVQWLLESGKGPAVDRGLHYLKSRDEWYADSVEVNPLLVAANVHDYAPLESTSIWGQTHGAASCYCVAEVLPCFSVLCGHTIAVTLLHARNTNIIAISTFF